MKRPQKFRSALSGAVVFVAVTNIAFGFMGYDFFGEGTCSVVLLNLGDRHARSLWCCWLDDALVNGLGFGGEGGWW